MSRTCPKCSRKMEQGYVIDAGDYSVPTIANWHAGSPQKSWWGLKTSKAAKREIVSWRCTGCGYLENYAP